MNSRHLRITNEGPLTTPAFIYFDLDDTLLEHSAAEKQALAYLCEHYAEALNGHTAEHVQQTYRTFNIVLWRRYANNEIDRHDVQRLRFEMLLESLNVHSHNARSVGETYLKAYSRFWQLNPDAFHAVRKIAERYRIGLITNGFADIQRAKLDLFPELASLMEATVISEEVGVMKPHRRIFDHAAALAHCMAEQLLYVGDSYTSDVVGASRAGWHVAWLTSNPQEQLPPRTSTFANWNELLARLGFEI